MNEIIQRVMDRTGLPQDKAMMAADTVIGFLKERLPAPVSSQLDSFMSDSDDNDSRGDAGNAGLAGKAASMGSNLGGMFGNKQ